LVTILYFDPIVFTNNYIITLLLNELKMTNNLRNLPS
jgi:hypothetical protein